MVPLEHEDPEAEPVTVSDDATADKTPEQPDDAPEDLPTFTEWVTLKVKQTSIARRLARNDCPYRGWAFVYGLTLTLFFAYRCNTLGALIAMYGSEEDDTVAVVLGALTLGFLEDFVCVTYFACILWSLDSFKRAFACCGQGLVARVVGGIATFLISWLLFVLVVTPVIADGLIVRLRDMRFTLDIAVMAIDEKDNASSFEVSDREVTDAVVNVLVLVVSATIFATVRTRAPWADLSTWNPTHIPLRLRSSHAYNAMCFSNEANSDKRQDVVEIDPLAKAAKADTGTPKYVTVDVNDATESSEADTTSPSDGENDSADRLSVVKKPNTSKPTKRQYVTQFLVAIVGLVVLPLLVIALSRASSPLVAYSALDTSVNELLGHAFQPYADGSTLAVDEADLPWVETYIHHATENHKLFGNDTLYRKTTGFKGDLAFDVKVNPKNPPYVLLIVVESFRFHDSHYLVGEEDPSNLFKGTNITITPNFDKWAKRGIALRNYWSSWRTSRSVESLLFAQLPYDHVTKSGMTGGQKDTKLSGLPQLFSAKGYETFFTTGCKTNYDGWDAFLPAHGFDTVWSRNEMKKLAESDLGIKRGDWNGPEHRGLNWGTKEQTDRVARGEPKKPLFLNHYTISSHVNYKQRPKWYDESEKPDFSALYEGQKYADNIKNYLEIRYFTDMEFGKFMDRMSEAGILDDTIVVVSGDHGQGPEFGNDVPEDRDVSATRVAGAIVAEGRLGKAVGMVMDDATEQYDILNTLADITGVPEGGFEQDGVGRSLKRKIKFGERVVYSNNPTRKMSVVRGHERLRYDRVTDVVLLHNADTDHDMKHDLLPSLPQEQRTDWLNWRDAGRRINSYYTKRWQAKCFLAAEC
ncbi:hypothetical protein PF010_g18962 [Phytophthora fragariae]|uniref:Sulfatase N-terminal domain-containing protein n=2 Tax=Phytophthora fragariae TaxID=53985 RepID=A0A6A3JAW8_9STRA|nr:hypothetical protein PF003_g15588 [Phytophthora fragariae]KAE8928996.1 hypothetical protein PF009_g20881 [Phytophthora fragariae]KAE8989485.1 hypothetical protein PF011_g18757 [Phytophthora fragariae]KAE9089521.1 hypothetical protein PF010_g18962 [Phytophthora fragariae]KAE9118350.1 hypothetical protein PF006_g18617 [Phytophthora fragariae]